MKKILCFTICLAALFSCSSGIELEEPGMPEDVQMENREISLTATIGGETKSVLTEGDKVMWSPGDQISVFYNGNHSIFVSNNSTPVPVSNFLGHIYVPSDAVNEHLQLYGIYPYSMGNAILSGGVMRTSLATDQIAVEGTFAKDMSISAGKSNGLAMTFYNVCGLLEFTLTRDNIKKVFISGNNNEVLSGMLKVKWENDKPVVESVTGSKSLTLSKTDGTCLQKGARYYFVIPPTIFEQGVTLKFQTSDDKIFVKSIGGRKEIARSVIKSIAEADKDAIEQDVMYVEFADEAFEQYCLDNFDTDKDSKISLAEAAQVKTIYYPGRVWNEEEGYWQSTGIPTINSLAGIENFTELETLVCVSYKVGGLTSLDLSKNTKLKYLDISRNENLTLLNISNCNDLEYLDCSSPCYLSKDEDEIGRYYIPTGKLEELDLTGNTKLVRLDCAGLQLKSLDLSKCTELKNLVAFYNEKLHTLKLDSHPKLDSLYLTACKSLNKVNLTGCPNLTWVSIWRIPDISADFSACAKLDQLYLTRVDNVIIPESGLNALRHLSAGFPFSGGALELSKFPNLKNLDTWNCTSLDLSACPGLEAMGVHRNLLSSLDVSMCRNMHYLCLSTDGKLSFLNISNNLNLGTFISGECSTLKRLVVALGQNIDGVTVNRSVEKIHPNTEIYQYDGMGTEDFGREDF